MKFYFKNILKSLESQDSLLKLKYEYDFFWLKCYKFSDEKLNYQSFNYLTKVRSFEITFLK